jgi:hypothetical protein
MTMRTVTYLGAVALLSQVLLVHGCGSNNPSTGSTGGTTGAAGAAATTPTGGTTDTTSAAGGSATTPTGGATAVAGTTGAAGASGTSTYQPMCKGLVTVGGAEPAKLVVCTDADPQLCYKTCGPKSIGFKSETCTGGSYQEQTGCDFPPDVDYSCYKIPATIDPTCPTTTPQASQPCSVADCVLCNVADSYLDSTGASKAGYCVCPTPTSATATSKWTCASKSAWPCPSGKGC